MSDTRMPSKGSRRLFLKGAAAGAAGFASRCAVAYAAAERDLESADATVRDRLWIFTCPAGTDNDPTNRYGLPGISRMTPAEGAFYLNVPNLLMIRASGKPPMPSDQYAIPFKPLRRVVWSITGSGGTTSEEAREDAIRLAHRFPNIVGFIMDDFFHGEGAGQFSPDQLQTLRKRFVIDGRTMDLYVVLYTHQLNWPVGEHLKHCDKITLWTWNSKDLKNLEQNFARLERLAPDHGKLLGCYTWDYPNKQSVPLDLMEKQCQLGLRWLREGRIEGIIFLANTTGDFEVPAWEFARDWIEKVGDEHL